MVAPEGLPLAYEVLSGKTSDKTTLRDCLERIERQYGKTRRIGLVDRGVPTEEVLAEMRQADLPVQYLVGAPQGRLTRSLRRHEGALRSRPSIASRLAYNCAAALAGFLAAVDKPCDPRLIQREHPGVVWAVTWSAELGLDIDNPFVDSGNLSRVVSGVTLYPVSR